MVNQDHYRTRVGLNHARRRVSTPPMRNANKQASALPGNTNALVTTASHLTASGGAKVGSVVEPGIYGGMRPGLKKNHAAA